MNYSVSELLCMTGYYQYHTTTSSRTSMVKYTYLLDSVPFCHEVSYSCTASLIHFLSRGILFWYLWQLYEEQWLGASSHAMETQFHTHACLLIFHGLSCYKADFSPCFSNFPCYLLHQCCVQLYCHSWYVRSGKSERMWCEKETEMVWWLWECRRTYSSRKFYIIDPIGHGTRKATISRML